MCELLRPLQRTDPRLLLRQVRFDDRLPGNVGHRSVCTQHTACASLGSVSTPATSLAITSAATRSTTSTPPNQSATPGVPIAIASTVSSIALACTARPHARSAALAAVPPTCSRQTCSRPLPTTGRHWLPGPR
jgi:hypothetical protein